MISFLKKTAWTFFALAAFGWLARKWIFAAFFWFKIDTIISTQLVENQGLMLKKATETEVDSVIFEALDQTALRLKFSFEKAPQTAESVAKTGKANCVGYAVFFKFVLEKKLAEKNLLGNFLIEHQRGRLHFLGFDLHPFLKNPFWKNHDFVVVRSRSTTFKRTVDPSLFDFSGIAFINK